MSDRQHATTGNPSAASAGEVPVGDLDLGVPLALLARLERAEAERDQWRETADALDGWDADA